MLAGSRKTIEVRGDLRNFPVAANTLIHQGALVVLDGGYAKGGIEATGLIAVGRAEETVDNRSGAAGAKSITVKGGVFIFKNDSTNPVTRADIGKDCYIVDDETVSNSHNTNARSVAGKVYDLPSGNGVAVAAL